MLTLSLPLLLLLSVACTDTTPVREGASTLGTAGTVVALRGWNAGNGWQEAGTQAPRLGGCAPGPELDPAGRCLPRLGACRA